MQPKLQEESVVLNDIWNFMILVKLEWNTPLYKVDEFVTKFKKKYKNKRLRVDVKLSDNDCIIFLYKQLN